MRTILALLSLFLPVAALAADSPKRPNILFIFADDWGRHASAYRAVDGADSIQGVVSTPNFDRIAREGVLFKHAFVTAPSCTPCRSSLLSGQYFWRTGLGAILNGARWDSSIPSYPLLLKGAGYHIGSTLKVWSPGTPADAPYGAPAHRYVKAGGDISRFAQHMMKAADRDAKKREIFAQVAGNFKQFLGDRKAGEPWCYWYGPTQVHRPFVKGSGKELWGIDPDSLKGRLPKFLPDNEVVRGDVADYLGEVQSLDASVGVLLAELEATGELENTMIVMSGDHGLAGVSHGKCNLYDFGTNVALAVRWGAKVPGGRVVDDFVNLMDLAPTFLEAAGEKPPEVMTGRSVMNVLTSRESGQVDPARDFVITGRERHVGEAREGAMPYPQRAIRTAEFLYIRNFKPERWPMGTPEGPTFAKLESAKDKDAAVEAETRVAYADMDASPTKAGHETENRAFFDYAFAKRPGEELYDLKKDPDQMKNVAEDPAYAAAKAKLSERLMAELKRTGDPRVTGEGTTFDNPPFAGSGAK
jgi:N-sulfoglucosamine sulfohydrolase